MSADVKRNIFERSLHKINNRKFVLDSLPCRMNCGQGGTCLKEPLLPEHPPVCRCDKGFIKRKDGKCVGTYFFKQNIIFYNNFYITIGKESRSQKCTTLQSFLV